MIGEREFGKEIHRAYACYFSTPKVYSSRQFYSEILQHQSLPQLIPAVWKGYNHPIPDSYDGSDELHV